MDTRGVLYFLAMLEREVPGHSEALKALWQQALDENDDVAALRTLLDANEYTYYHAIGRSLLARGEEQLQAIYHDPAHALEIMPQVQRMRAQTEAAVSSCSARLTGPYPFTDEITVIRSRDILPHMRVMEAIAGAAVCLAARYGGADAVRRMSWHSGVGIQELISELNTQILPVLCDLPHPADCWVIRRRQMQGNAVFGGNAFFLCYESAASVGAATAALRKARLSANASVNPDAMTQAGSDVPCCWGTGNLISAEPADGLRLLRSNAVTRLRTPRTEELSAPMPAPGVLMRRLADDCDYIISPDELVLAMNRWHVGHTIAERRAQHCCLFCGRPVISGRTVCASHFGSLF